MVRGIAIVRLFAGLRRRLASVSTRARPCFAGGPSSRDTTARRTQHHRDVGSTSAQRPCSMSSMSCNTPRPRSMRCAFTSV